MELVIYNFVWRVVSDKSENSFWTLWKVRFILGR